MNMLLQNLSNIEILDCFVSVVSCDHYCPIECGHDKRFSFDELKEEIILRMERKI